jgi:hypothetical protein
MNSVMDEQYEKVLALDQDLKLWPYVWIGVAYLPERKKQKCKVVGKRSKKHKVLEVEFEDGTRVMASEAFFRKRPVR